MKKKIIVAFGEQRFIAKTLNCTQVMVCYALSYKKDSMLARKIRKMAMERGGVEVELPSVPKQQIV